MYLINNVFVVHIPPIFSQKLKNKSLNISLKLNKNTVTFFAFSYRSSSSNLTKRRKIKKNNVYVW